MKSLRIIAGICLIFSFSFSSFTSHAKDEGVRSQIISHFNYLQGKVTSTKIKTLFSGLIPLSSANADMCFISLDEYNDCQDKPTTLYDKLYPYMDDLIGKEVSVKVVKSFKPWEDENYYTLAFRISYVNDNPEYPVDVNFDTIDLGISHDRIKDVIHDREWFALSDYAKYQEHGK